MIDPPHFLDTVAQTIAVVRITVPRSEIRTVMGPGLKELRAALDAQGIAPLGPWFTHHFRMSPDVFDFEIGLPVAQPVRLVGRVTNGVRPATTVARTRYHGPYEGLPGAWPQLDAWIVANGRTPDSSLWETYVTDPSENPDPSTWVTELTRPLRG